MNFDYYKSITSVPEIKCTINYNIFSFLEENRDVSHTRRIKDSINKIGLIPVPIICNENMQIIDGQGRFSACKELGLPVYYIVIPGLSIKHCIGMNVSQTNWSMLDFIKSYAAQGNQNYCVLLEMMKRHPALGYKVITSASMNCVQGADNSTIKNGLLKIEQSKIDHAEELCDWLDNNAVPLKPKTKGRFECLCFALIFSYEHSGANADRLCEIIKDYVYEFSPFTTVKETLSQIERFYNRNLRSNKIYFLTEYDKYLTETNVTYANRWGNK